MSQPRIINPRALNSLTNISEYLVVGCVPVDALAVFINGVSAPLYSSVELQQIKSAMKYVAGFVFPFDFYSITPNAQYFAYTIPLVLGTNLVDVYFQPAGTQSPYSPSDAEVVTYTIENVSSSELQYTIAPPTGVTLEVSDLSFWLSVNKPADDRVSSVRFYGSDLSGGGSNGYTLLLECSSQDYFGMREEIQSSSSSTTQETIDNTINRTTVSLEEVQKFYYYKKQITSLGGTRFTDGTRYYFVVSFVAYDPVTSEEVESKYSVELMEYASQFRRNVLPQKDVSQSKIREQLVNRVYDDDPTLDVKPLSEFSDVVGIPVGFLAEKQYILLKWARIRQSFLSLMALDDLNGDGESDPVVSGSFKAKLMGALDTDERGVQLEIDAAFEALAANVYVFRKSAERASGTVTFYRRVATDIDRPILDGYQILGLRGGVSVPIIVKGDYVMRTSIMQSYFNPERGRYELEVQVQALDPGIQGSIPAGAIVGSIPGFDGATNYDPFIGGRDSEPNYKLAQRAMLLPAGSDLGMTKGYIRTIAEMDGVSKVTAIPSGNAYMWRDYEQVLGRHIAGTVDIYLEGFSRDVQTDTFGFVYPDAQDEQFDVQNFLLYAFRSRNPLVSADSPIFNVTQVFNETRNRLYDLTGLVCNGPVVVLAVNSANLAIGLSVTDTILVSYSYYGPVEVPLQKRPVLAVTQVSGTVAGVITPSIGWKMLSQSDAATYGGSSFENTSVLITRSSGKPAGLFYPVLEEETILYGEVYVPLFRLGVLKGSVVAQSSDLNTTYVYGSDYLIRYGTAFIPTAIRRIIGGNIVDGDTVKISYDAAEEFSITYETNTLIERAQTRIEERRHTTADVVVKQAPRMLADIEYTVQMKRGGSKEQVDRDARALLYGYVARQNLGTSLFRSDVIGLAEQVAFLNYVVFPLIRMTLGDGSQIVREPLLPLTLTRISQSGYGAWVTSSITGKIGVLTYATMAGGGQTYDPVILYHQNIPLTRVYSEGDVTLQLGQFFVRPDGNIVMSPYELAHLDQYELSYAVYGDSQTIDIVVPPYASLSIGNLTINVVAA